MPCCKSRGRGATAIKQRQQSVAAEFIGDCAADVHTARLLLRETYFSCNYSTLKLLLTDVEQDTAEALRPFRSSQ